jgi:hypothetical protein
MPGGQVFGQVFPVGSSGWLWTSPEKTQGREADRFRGVLR